MTKAELTALIQQKCGLPKNDAIKIVEGTFEIMKGALERGQNIRISGFGNFVVRTKRARKGRNPHSGDEIILPEHKLVTFKPSQIMRKHINAMPVA